MNKKLQQKWEKRLQKHGLAVDQPLTNNSAGETEVTMGGESDAYTQLRAAGIDGGDQFMEAFQIMKVRTIEREIPEWVFSDKEVQRVLLAAFPTQAVNKAARKRAGRWARIIYLYYRMMLPQQIVAKEIGLTEQQLKLTLQRINRVEKGYRTDGKLRVVDTPPTPREGTGRKGNETK